MNKSLLLLNKKPVHYEIIESIIVKYYEILNIETNIQMDIHLYIHDNKEYINYIQNKYPKIIIKTFIGRNFRITQGIINNFDYCINCTIYDVDFGSLNKNKNSNIKYISHEITDRLKKNPNVYFLTPLSKSNYIYTDILPFSDNKIKSNIPIYIIQGNLDERRRNYKLLVKILSNNYKHDFIIKLLGKGRLPNCLEKYKNKILLRNNLNFINYHKELLNAYCILPLISKKSHPKYYNIKLTSTINYARGYKLKCLIDKDLQEIYNLDDVEVYNNINDISNHFSNTLDEFCNNQKDIE